MESEGINKIDKTRHKERIREESNKFLSRHTHPPTGANGSINEARKYKTDLSREQLLYVAFVEAFQQKLHVNNHRGTALSGGDALLEVGDNQKPQVHKVLSEVARSRAGERKREENKRILKKEKGQLGTLTLSLSYNCCCSRTPL